MYKEYIDRRLKIDRPKFLKLQREAKNSEQPRLKMKINQMDESSQNECDFEQPTTNDDANSTIHGKRCALVLQFRSRNPIS